MPEARTILVFTQRAAAIEIEKVLRSAVANAESAHGLDGDELVVEAAYADEGPTLKRWRARARGRANRIRKRSCHITRRSGARGARPAEASQGKVAPQAESASRRDRVQAQAPFTRAKKEGAAA